MTPPPGPKTTDQRQVTTIADAIIVRLDEYALVELAEEGRRILAGRPVDWAKLLDWNRRACAELVEANRKR